MRSLWKYQIRVKSLFLIPDGSGLCRKDELDMTKNIVVRNRVDLERENLAEGFKNPGRRLAIGTAALYFWGMFFIDMFSGGSSIELYVMIMAIWATLAVIFWEPFTNFEMWFWSLMD